MFNIAHLSKFVVNFNLIILSKSKCIVILKDLFNDILHMSFLAGTHVFKAFPAYTTTEL